MSRALFLNNLKSDLFALMENNGKNYIWNLGGFGPTREKLVGLAVTETQIS